MDSVSDKKFIYINLLNRIQKKISSYEGLLLMKKLYFTDNIFFYFLSLVFRFIHLISFCGDYNILSNSTNKTIKQNIKIFTCHYLIQQFDLSYNAYIFIDIIIIILFIIRMTIIIYILKKLKNYKYTGKWPLPSNLQIIIDHIMTLLFPYIIEYLSFIYYIYFVPNRFIIKTENPNKVSLILICIINSILIIVYNIENYFNLICSNKIFTVTIFEVYSNIKGNKTINNKPISYRCSNITFFIFILMQNFVLFLNADNYANIKNKIIIKISISIILLVIIFLYFLTQLNEFNYNNFINSSINILILFCFYSIIIDFIIFISRYQLNKKINEILYILFKLLLSYITFSLYILKTKSFLESKIIQILFEEKNSKNEKYFINSFYYFHQIMLKIKGKNKIDFVLILINILSNHINKCNKTICNCKLFEAFINKSKNNNIKINNARLKNYLPELLTIFTYLFEYSFIDYDFYKNCDLSILLAEHFCHLKNNPTMAFSVITTFLLKQRNNINKMQLVSLYELSQKYIYYIISKIAYDLELENNGGNEELFINKKRTYELRKYYLILKMSYKVNRLISNYIDNEIKIIKYKSIFEEFLSFQFDNNDNIISVKIDFFKERIIIDNLYSKNNQIKKKNVNNKINSNLYIIIYLLKKEQFFYQKLINSIIQIDIIKEIPIFLIFKYFLFFDFFEGGKIPTKIASKLYKFLSNKTNLNNRIIKKTDYLILKNRYNERINRNNFKFNTIFELKKDLRIKYFSEVGTLKLGYNQKDIINKKIDVLMPIIFYESHINAIKKLIIGDQIKNYNNKEAFYFDKTHTILYSASFEISLICNISKTLIVLNESTFNNKNEYTFMLDNNFELLSSTKNFEDEYFLNQRLMKMFNIGLMDILKIGINKLYKVFKLEFNKIHYQKYLRQIKTDSYFIPHLYIESEIKSSKKENSSISNISKNILSKLLNPNIDENSIFDNIININQDEDEDKQFLNNNINIKREIYKILNKSQEVIFSKIYRMKINKKMFIENIAKKLIKITDNDIMLENDEQNYYLIMSAKKIFSKLSKTIDLSKEFLLISIKFIFLYDKPYYFISINDEKKLFLNISKEIYIEKKQSNQFINSISITESSISKTTTIPFNKSDKNTRNKISSRKIKYLKIMDNKNEINLENKISKDKNGIILPIILPKHDKNAIIKKINDKNEGIKKNKFIKYFRFILSIIIIFILVLYFIVIFTKSFFVYISDEILYAYYYNALSRDSMLFIHSKLFQVYYDYLGLTENLIMDKEDYQIILTDLSLLLQDSYYNFWDYFFYYNSDIDHEYNLILIYQKNNLSNIRGFWQELNYELDFSSDIDIIIYYILAMNITNRNSIELKSDLKNFLFFNNKTNIKERVYTLYIKLLYYFCANYEFVYKDIFLEFERTLYKSFKNDIKIRLIYFILYDTIALLLFIIFYIIVNAYLYYSNEIIIKNIIFLFLDFCETKFEYEINNNNNNTINLKLKEFKNLIENFDLNRFDNFSTQLDNIHHIKSVYLNEYKFKKTNIVKKNSINDSKIESKFDSKIESKFGSKIESKFGSKIDSKFDSRIDSKFDSKIDSIKDVINKSGKNSNNNSKKNQKYSYDENVFLDSKNNRMNNSSHNYLSDSKSKFFNDKSNNINLKPQSLFSINNNNNSNSLNILTKQNLNNNNNIDNSFQKNENEENQNIQDIILNKSNKIFIFFIKIYSIIMSCIILIVIIFNLFKILKIIRFNNQFDNFFSDFTIITNRYSGLFYFFNNFRTLLIFQDDNRKKHLEKIIESLEEYYENDNKKFISILSNNGNSYPEIIDYINILMESKNNSTEIIAKELCYEEPGCINYLDSSLSIMGSGIDFAYKSCINNIKNLYIDYTNLKNKSDINEINLTLIQSRGSEFIQIELSLSYIFYNTQEKLYDFFGTHIDNFIQSYNQNMTILNIISIILSIFAFSFVIFIMYFSILKYIKPIKESCFRINCSFLYIKNYDLPGYKKNENIIPI